MDWKIINRKTVYRGFLSIEEYQLKHELFNGAQSNVITRQLMERGHAVAVLIFDPYSDKLILIQQFRIGAKEEKSPWLTELVAGMIDEGESAIDVARRESREEAGVEISNCREIMTYYASPGGCSEKITLFYAEADSDKAGGIHGLDAENEDINVVVMEYEDAMQQLNDGVINSATPILALQWLKIHHHDLIKS